MRWQLGSRSSICARAGDQRRALLRHAVRPSLPETTLCSVFGLGRFELHADTQLIEVDRLPLASVPQHPGQVCDQLFDSFTARVFADRLGTPRAERIVGAIEVDLDDD